MSLRPSSSIACSTHLLLLSRLGLQHGDQLPFPQLESVRHRLCSALHPVPVGTEVHAGKPQVPAGGESPAAAGALALVTQSPAARSLLVARCALALVYDLAYC